MKKVIKYFINSANILFAAALLIVAYVPSVNDIDSIAAYIVALCLIEAGFLFSYVIRKRKSSLNIATIAFALLIVWDLASRLGYTHPVLVPPPENVFYVFVTEWEDMVAGTISSLKLLGQGVGLALIAGVFLGLVVGWIPSVKNTVLPIANVISPIPPLVYTPYVVAVAPSFKIASIFVIFCAVFWPTFQSMVGRVSSVDKKVIQSAQVMKVSTPTMLFRVILPYCMPGIISGLNMNIRVALLCLVGAELIGAGSGLGYFVKKYSNFADYTKVLAGIILIGIVVTVLFALVGLLERKLIKWDYT